MFRFINEMTFYAVIFYCVTLIMGFLFGLFCARFEREGEHIALIRNLLNIARSGRFTATAAFTQMKERLEAWEDNQNEL